MIRVSNGPIRISKFIDDKWGQPIGYWSVNSYGYVGLEKYQDLRFFESMPTLSERLILTVNNKIHAEEDFLRAAYKSRMDRLRATNSVYQFDALRDPKKDLYLRMCVVLCNGGSYALQYCSSFDAYVKYPFYNAICWIANGINNLRGRLYGKSTEE